MPRPIYAMSVFGHLRLKRRVPMGVAHLVLQQPVALAHRLVIGKRSISMTRIKAQNHAVKKAPPPFGPFDPETIHRRDQPEHPGNATQRKLARCLIVDPDLPRGAVFRRDLDLMNAVLRRHDTG